MKQSDKISLMSGILGLIAAVIPIIDSGRSNASGFAFPFLIVCLILLLLTVVLQWDRIKFYVLRPLGVFFEPLIKFLPISFIFLFLFFLLLLWLILGKPEWNFLRINEQIGHLEDLIALFNLIISLLLVIIFYSISLKYYDLLVRSKTQFIGTLPDNLTDIIELIKTTKKELFIAVDFPSYGCYSDPELNDDYQKAIYDILRKQGVKLRMIIYGNQKALSASKEQFEHLNWENINSSADFETFVNYHRGRSNIHNFDDLVKSFLDLDNEFITQLNNRGFSSITKTESTLPMYMWISDKERAIFSFYNLKGNSSEVSFFTKDSKVISILRSIFGEYYRG
jgi:hypothetical protein